MNLNVLVLFDIFRLKSSTDVKFIVSELSDNYHFNYFST